MCFRRSKRAVNAPPLAPEQPASAGTPKYVGYYLVAYNVLSSFVWAYIFITMSVRLAGLIMTPEVVAPPQTRTSVFSRIVANIHLLRSSAPTQIQTQTQTDLPPMLQRIFSGSGKTYTFIGLQTAIVQSFAVLEVLHARSRWTQSGIITTAIQVTLRLVLVWGAAEQRSENRQSFYYGAVVWLWAFTEFMRYAFLATSTQQTPRWLAWLRYITFFILFTKDAGSEAFGMVVTPPVIPAELPKPRWFRATRSVGDDVRAIMFLIVSFILYVMYIHTVGSHMEVSGSGSSRNRLRNNTTTSDALSTATNTPARRGRCDHIAHQSPTMLSPVGEKPPPVTRLLSTPSSPQVQRLRNLAHKLITTYPSQAIFLKDLLESMSEPDEPGGFIDVRGSGLTMDQPPVHVFVDYSNIHIGFLTYIRQHPVLHQRRSREDQPHLSHEALALILERGRSVERRDLAASKPLYQPLTNAYALGFDVHLFLRVPHEDSGSPDLDLPLSPVAPTRSRGRRGRRGARLATQPAQPPTTQPRWREQGVDECLQLKVYQSVTGDGPPGTIVLATGDGAPSQFNATGFTGCVKAALDRGWHVELYSWESCLSSEWKKEFGTHERFSVRHLEMFAADLVALDPPA